MAGLVFAIIFAVSIVLDGTFADDDPKKVVGGINAHVGEFPYQISLRFRGSHICGGSLVTERHVVTAAHCISSTTFSDYAVVTGTVTLKSGGETHHVSKIVVNPDYKPTPKESYRNDIAVVVLSEPVKQNAYQRVIRLSTHDPAPGTAMTLTGWGRLRADGPLPNNLQKATVHLLSNRDCQRQIPNYHIYDGQVCTILRKGVGACNGDSGGPLVANGALVGVVSWVFPCATGMPDAFTRVSSYLNFVNNVISST